MELIVVGHGISNLEDRPIENTHSEELIRKNSVLQYATTQALRRKMCIFFYN